MTTQTPGRTLQEAKRQIAQKSKDFEARIMKARNEFEQIAVLNDMTEIIDAEIFQWTAKLEEYQENQSEDASLMTEEAAKHVCDLSELLVKINEHRKIMLPKALAIQQAMLNSHQLKTPIIVEP